MNRLVIAGIGCRRNCAAEDIEAALGLACATAGRRAGSIAVPDFKAQEPGVHLAATRLGLTLLVIDVAALIDAQPHCPTRSAAAARALGVASVAEGCALAACGPGGRLVLPRLVQGGASCALAEPS